MILEIGSRSSMYFHWLLVKGHDGIEVSLLEYLKRGEVSSRYFRQERRLIFKAATSCSWVFLIKPFWRRQLKDREYRSGGWREETVLRLSAAFRRFSFRAKSVAPKPAAPPCRTIFTTTCWTSYKSSNQECCQAILRRFIRHSLL